MKFISLFFIFIALGYVCNAAQAEVCDNGDGSKIIRYEGKGHIVYTHYTTDSLQHLTFEHNEWGFEGRDESGMAGILVMTEEIYYNSDGSTTIYEYNTWVPNSRITSNLPNSGVVTIYPIPASDVINIELKNYDIKSGIEISITDIAGRCVHKSISESQEIHVSCGEISNGTYMLTLSNNNGIITSQKIIIIK